MAYNVSMTLSWCLECIVIFVFYVHVSNNFSFAKITVLKLQLFKAQKCIVLFIGVAEKQLHS